MKSVIEHAIEAYAKLAGATIQDVRRDILRGNLFVIRVVNAIAVA